jgi:hypothetical protein
MGARGAMASPDFDRSVNPISTRWGRFFSPNNTGTPGFSDLPKTLNYISYVCIKYASKMSRTNGPRYCKFLKALLKFLPHTQIKL